MTILELQATRRPKSDNKCFSATGHENLNGDFSKDSFRARENGTVPDHVAWPNPPLVVRMRIDYLACNNPWALTAT